MAGLRFNIAELDGERSEPILAARGEKVRTSEPLFRYHGGKRGHVSLERYQNPDQSRQSDAVEEDVAKNFPFATVPIGGGARHHDALGVHHFAHDASGAVCGSHEDRADVGAFRGDLLKTSEEDVGSCV